MDRIWAPWRMEYILNEKPDHCIFCLDDFRDAATDRDRLVLCRDRRSFVMMNRYPYCNGHLLVAPLRHVGALNELEPEEMLELFRNTALCCDLMTRSFSPQGYNVGINLGKAAGAGVDDHLHIHVVPRWVGDTNYMTVIADVRVMPENLYSTFDRLYPLFLERYGAGDRSPAS